MNATSAEAAPLIIEPHHLEDMMGDENLVIVDLCKAKQFASAHIPDALFVSYGDIVREDKPVKGLVPDNDSFSKLLSSLGITADTHIVAYDDEGGGCAARFIWTLYVFGHENASILNGGLHSWANGGHALTNQPSTATPSDYWLTNSGMHTASRDYILQSYKNDKVALLDARTIQEYTGEKKFSDKGGHIPGAIRYEWTDAIDKTDNFRMLSGDILQKELDDLGLTIDKEIICYCQSHHRSAYSWLMLRSLGYENVKGYPGAWSDWGNQPDTPVEM